MVRGSNPEGVAGTSGSLGRLANTVDAVRRNENAASERTMCLRELFSISASRYLHDHYIYPALAEARSASRVGSQDGVKVSKHIGKDIQLIADQIIEIALRSNLSSANPTPGRGAGGPALG